MDKMKIVFAIVLLVTGQYSASLDEVQCCLDSKSIGYAAADTCEYEEETFLWNSRLNTTNPGLVVLPKSDKEVQDAVKCAAESKMTVSVKSGGHSYEGYWQGEKGGMVINLKNVKQIEIDCEAKTVSVGAGSLLGPVIAELWKVKGVLPHGLQPQIGMGGQTLGGGFGLLSRKYGLLVDRVVEMTVVTGDGQSRVVTKDKDADLFFALRGAGGGSYGVVTQFKYQYIEMARNLTVVRYNWNTDACNFTTVLGSIIKYYNSNPTRGATHYLSLSPGGQIELGVTYSNKKQESHKKAMQALEEIVAPPTTKDEQYLNFIDAFLFYAGLAGKPSSSDVNGLATTKSETEQRFFKGRSGFLDKSKQLTEKTMESLADLLTPTGSDLFVLIDLWGGNIEKVQNSSFVHRDIFASVQIGATSEKTLALADNVHKTLQPHFKGAYQNYIDVKEEDFMDTYYKEAKDRLQCIKKQYDPTNMFKFKQSIPLPSEDVCC